MLRACFLTKKVCADFGYLIEVMAVPVVQLCCLAGSSAAACWQSRYKKSPAAGPCFADLAAGLDLFTLPRFVSGL